MKKIIEDVLDHIYKAKMEAIKRNIEVNQVNIDEDLAMTNHLYFPNVDGSISETNPMIFGLAINYVKNLRKDGYNFVVGYNPRLDEKQKTLADYTTKELLEELQRRNEENE